MDHSGCTDGACKRHEAALLDVGNKLANPPSSIDELLGLLSRAEFILIHVRQLCSCHKVIMSMVDAIRPVMRALISDKLIKHPFLDVQVAVASCINQIIRITISDYPYTDAQMKQIFELFNVAFKQLSCESGKNYERALRIIEYGADIKSCLIMLDLDVEMDTLIAEMFQIFLDTVRPHHSSDVFNHMKTIMILIIQESDEISVELLKTLLSSVRMENKNASPRSWELGKSVFENCVTILKQHVRNAVEAGNLNVADYAEIVASLCQDTPTGNDTVANQEIKEVENNVSGDGVSKLDERSQVGLEMQEQADRRRREVKPNTLMRPEEGYRHAWLGGGCGSLLKENDSVKKVIIRKKDQPKNKEKEQVEINSKINEMRDVVDKVVESIVKEKHTIIRKKTSRRFVSGSIAIGAKKNHELVHVVEKEVDSSTSKPTKVKRSKEVYKGSNKEKQTTNGVLRCRTVGAANAKVSEGNVNGIISEKHEAGAVVDKVVESPTSKCAKPEQYKVEEKSFNRQKKKPKTVVRSSNVVTNKEKVRNSAADSIAKDKNEIASLKHESADDVEKAIERLAKQSKVDEKASNKQKKTTKSCILLSRKVSSKKVKVRPNVADLKEKGDDEITYHKHESTDVVEKGCASAGVVEKVVESSMSKPTKTKAKENGSNKWKRATEIVEPHMSRKAEYPEDLDSDKEKEPMDFRLEYGRELINLRIMVWWPLDQTYYTGTVESYDPITKKHKIKYDDDEEETLDMSAESWELFSERQSQKVQSSSEHGTDPSPATKPCKSKSEGIDCGHSALESMHVNDESDDDGTSEAHFSWKARAMSRVGKQKSNASRRKGKPTRSAPNDVKSG